MPYYEKKSRSATRAGEVARCTNGGGVIFRQPSAMMVTYSYSTKLALVQPETPRAQSLARGPEGAIVP